MINIVASIYASENNLDNCILLNHHKRVAEVMNGNIFMVTGDIIKTPPLSEGCIKGIVRKRIMGWLKIDQDLSLQEVPISPFELQKADEVFISNSIIGVQPVTQFRNSVYKSTISLKLQKAIDDSI
jgi:branched-chain amino acid aminotransferase